MFPKGVSVQTYMIGVSNKVLHLIELKHKVDVFVSSPETRKQLKPAEADRIV